MPVQPSGAAPAGNVLIARMRERADLSQEAKLPRGPERRTAVFEDLTATAQRSQTDALARLSDLTAKGLVTHTESMYLPNAILITAAPGKHQAVADALRGVASVAEVAENKLWSNPTQPNKRIVTGEAPRLDSGAPAPEWGVAKIGAPEAWARGYDGSGVTIGVVDTGLDSTHPALASHYRGTTANGTQVHDYNWLDATPAHKAAPYDDGEHGTHVAGSAAGGNDSRAIGVAPGAKIIAAKALLESGYNSTDATLKALQFMLAPTDTSGAHPDPTRGADVVNNSWGNADKTDRTFEETWDGLLAAGIVPVTAAGNDGPRGGTVSPPGSFAKGISVAATTSSDAVAKFSSRGPSQHSPEATVPLMAAPGANIVSSLPKGKWGAFSGTSMASPHIAGAVAILLQAKPTASYEEIVAALTASAVDVDAPGVDPAAGFGRIDVNRAIDVLLKGAPQQPAPSVR